MSATPQPAQLTAAEALVLQNPQLAQGRAALKVTMMELLARRILTMRHDERKGMFGRNQRTDYLVLASNAAQLTPQAAHIRAVVNMLRAADASGQGAAMTTVLAQARKTFGADLSAFQNKHVLPMLIERGLVEPYQAKRLGIFSTTKYRPTTQGDIVRQQLAMHLEQARALPNVIERDPMQAAVLVATLGSSVLLVDELKPFYSRLSQAMRTAANDAGGDVLVVDNDDNIEDSSTLDSHDFGGFDFDFDAFDSLDSSQDAFDSSFDSSSDSGSDGGGDGGGGSD
jgi:hypothetical protein